MIGERTPFLVILEGLGVRWVGVATQASEICASRFLCLSSRAWASDSFPVEGRSEWSPVLCRFSAASSVGAQLVICKVTHHAHTSAQGSQAPAGKEKNLS